MIAEHRALHADIAHSTSRQLAQKWIRSLKWHYLLLLLSDYGREIIEHKYDAFTTDRAYENQPSGKGVIGKLVDWYVHQLDIHVGLRQRLAIVVDELATAAPEFRETRTPLVRIVSGPCGLARDLRLVWARLRAEGKAPHNWLQVIGVDLDLEDNVLPEAQRLAGSAEIPLNLIKCDLLNSVGLKASLAPMHVFLSIGVTVWMDPQTLTQFLRSVHTLSEPGGLLIVDNFREHKASRYAKDMEQNPRYHTDADFERCLTTAGFEIEGKHATKNGINVVYRARRKAD
jgi:hypothetical protein